MRRGGRQAGGPRTRKTPASTLLRTGADASSPPAVAQHRSPHRMALRSARRRCRSRTRKRATTPVQERAWPRKGGTVSTQANRATAGLPPACSTRNGRLRDGPQTVNNNQTQNKGATKTTTNTERKHRPRRDGGTGGDCH